MLRGQPHSPTGPTLAGRLRAIFTELARATSSRKLSLLHPAAHPPRVGQVLLSEGAFQITLLALDHFALDYVQCQRQEEDGPQSVPKNRYPDVDHRQREVAGVAAVAERPLLDEAGYGLVGAERSVGAVNCPSEPRRERYPTSHKRTPEDACHPARQEGDVQHSVHKQPQEEGKQV